MSLNVISNVYRLTAPGTFEAVEVERTVSGNDVVVRPHIVSVCHADLRYYTGNRRKEALEAKLPMALFHEGIGTVTNSKHPSFKEGDRVVIVPSIPGFVLNNISKEECCRNCRDGGDDNYCLNGEFLGSGYDGIGQSDLVISGENLVLVPDELEDDTAILAELCSVSLYAINRVGKSLTTANSPKVAVFGDGPVGYLTAAALHFVCGIEKENLLVFGAIEDKIAQFESFATTALVHDYDFKAVEGVNTVFECTGGKFSSSAINQSIDLLDYDSNLVLMGVTEDLVPINTRDILEKGITVKGSSRSTGKEFRQLMEAFKNPGYREVLSKLIPEEHFIVESPEDMRKAMEHDANYRGWIKTYLTLKWQKLK